MSQGHTSPPCPQGPDSDPRQDIQCLKITEDFKKEPVPFYPDAAPRQGPIFSVVVPKDNPTLSYSDSIAIQAEFDPDRMHRMLIEFVRYVWETGRPPQSRRFLEHLLRGHSPYDFDILGL